MPPKTRRCRTCDARLGLGHFRIMEGGRRSWTCRACEDEAGAELPAVKGEPPRAEHALTLAGQPREMHLASSCPGCGAENITQIVTYAELDQASRLAEKLVFGLLHAGCPGDVHVRLHRGRPYVS
jgi:hypothetical protein